MSDATNARDPTQTRRSPTQILIGLPETFTYTPVSYTHLTLPTKRIV